MKNPVFFVQFFISPPPPPGLFLKIYTPGIQSTGSKLRVPEPVLRIEEETEMMRTELLRKEKELLELKKKDIDQQLQGLKMQQQIKNNSVSYV